MTKPCPKCLGTGRVVNQEKLGFQMYLRRNATHLNLKAVAKGYHLSPGLISQLGGGTQWKP